MSKQRNQHKEHGNHRRQSSDTLEAQIAARAYELWQERGCPIGTPEEDWSRAEEELRHTPELRVKTSGGAA